MSELKITKDNFKELVLESEKTVLLDFYADWCAPCSMLAPILAEIAQENPGILVGKVNVDSEGELAAAFQISSIPAVFVVKNGEVTNASIGFKSKEEILAML
jgi:thioredoxin 1